jgi:arylsulfate sulfotransferase
LILPDKKQGEDFMNKTKFRRSIFLVLIFSFIAGFQAALAQTSMKRLGLLNSDITVTLNPSGLAPLSALAEFTTKLKCNVQVRVLGDIEVTKNIEDFTTSHAIPILGLYPNRLNAVRLTFYGHHGTPETRTLSIQTGPLPGTFPEIVISTAVRGLMEPGMNLSTLNLSNGISSLAYPMMFDTNGDVRWYLDLSQFNGSCLPFERIKNGNFIFGNGDSIYEYDVLGNLANQIKKPGYNFHHDVKELPNGNFIACVDKQGTTIVNSHGLINSTGDHMIEVDRTTGSIVTELDVRKVLDVSRNEQINSTGDWFHMNGIWYSEADDSFIISGRNQGVAKVSRTNQLKWILAAHQGWKTSGYDGTGFDTTPFLLTAVDASGNPYPSSIQDGLVGDDDFDWTWGQHAPMILPDGDFFIFDNGFERNFLFNGPLYSRGVEYRVREDNMTVRQIWDYGKERGPGMYSSIISDIDRLPLTQNRLIAPGIVQMPSGSYSKIVELSYPDKTVVFEATINFKTFLPPGGLSSGRFDNIFRSHRISIYP